MLKVKQLSYEYPNKKVLDNVSLELEKNQFISIVGESGVGKTTLFHLISGLLAIQSGDIEVDQNQISYMLQKDMLFEHKTVLENIMLPLQIKKISKNIAKTKALKLLSDFNFEHLAHHYPKQLSGGMRQRVAFLRTIAFERSILLLDEAFSALDVTTKDKMHLWYKQLQKKFNLSTILITHDLNEAIQLSDKIYVLTSHPGKIVGIFDVNSFTQDELLIKIKDLIKNVN